MYKKHAPQLRLRSIFTLKSTPQLRFLYIVRLMSHKAMGFAPRCAMRLSALFKTKKMTREITRFIVNKN
ncbi:hypothetical protein Hanom_Chr09g00826521 [Helianthus anomalus]